MFDHVNVLIYMKSQKGGNYWGKNVKKMYISGCLFLLKPEDCYVYLNLTVK